MTISSEQVRDALRTVQDPDLGRDLVTLNMVKDVSITGDDVSVAIELTTPACPLKDKIRQDIEQAIRDQAQSVGASVGVVSVEFSADVRRAGQGPPDQQNPLPDVKHVIAVGAGKGGVGKSTVAVNLAVALGRMGAQAGLLDGDIYGPSLTTMLGLDDLPPPMPEGNMLTPFEVHGIKAMTIGKLVPADRPLIWRGPMAHSAFKQLATQTEWGELDYLVVDLPPGTGDVPLTLAQLLPMTGAVIVCTPQKVALDDARRAALMFQQLEVAVLGIVENMSYFIGAGHRREHELLHRRRRQDLRPVRPGRSRDADPGDGPAVPGVRSHPHGASGQLRRGHAAAQLGGRSLAGRGARRLGQEPGRADLHRRHVRPIRPADAIDYEVRRER
jgi:ATP-binding protein involved in chromosome partitioning